jgi:hypothetical protein
MQMSGAMPYVLAENPVFKLLEAVNDPAVRFEGLKRLMNPNFRLWDSPAVQYSPDPAVEEHHLRAHWFGYNDDAPPVQELSNLRTTGWWAHWRGDAHGIMRQTLLRAYQASLNVTAADLLNINAFVPNVCKPIRIVWMCGAQQFQGFIVTDGLAAPIDHVTVVIATPGTDKDYSDFPYTVPFPAMVHKVPGPSNFTVIGKGVWVIGMTGYYLIQAYKIGPTMVNVAHVVGKSALQFVKKGTPVVPYNIRGSNGTVVTAQLPPLP